MVAMEQTMVRASLSGKFLSSLALKWRAREDLGHRQELCQRGRGTKNGRRGGGSVSGRLRSSAREGGKGSSLTP